MMPFLQGLIRDLRHEHKVVVKKERVFSKRSIRFGNFIVRFKRAYISINGCPQRSQHNRKQRWKILVAEVKAIGDGAVHVGARP